MAVITVLFLARNLNFYFDEYAFVLSSLDWTWQSYWYPVQQHWITLAAFVYRGELAAFGLRTHLPFVATLALLNAAVALLLFALIRRRSGDLPALAAMALILFMGQGYENIFQPYQITVVGSAFFGFGALWLLEQDSRWRRLGAAAALLAGVMCSGFGLFFVAAVTVRLAAERRWNALPEVVIPPVLAYAAWFLVLGSAGLKRAGWPHDLQSAWSLLVFTARGVGTTFTAVLGADARFGLLGLLVPAAAAVLWWRRGRLEPLVLASAAALVVQFALIGLERNQTELPAPRYLEGGAGFALIVLADCVRGLPWRPPWRPLFFVGLAAMLTLSTVYLVAAARGYERVEGIQDAELQTVALFRGAPDMNQDARVDPLVSPYTTPRLYYRAADRYGSPVPAIDLTGLDLLPPEAVDEAMRAMFTALLAESQGNPPGDATCTTGAAPFADERAGSGDSVWVSAAAGSTVSLELWFRGDPPGTTAMTFVAGGGWAQVHVPDTGRPTTWQVRLLLPEGSQASVCTRP